MSHRHLKKGDKFRVVAKVLTAEEGIVTGIYIGGHCYSIDDELSKEREVEKIIRVHNLDPNESEEFKEIVNALN